jgi:hypothetical protein
MLTETFTLILISLCYNFYYKNEVNASKQMCKIKVTKLAGDGKTSVPNPLASGTLITAVPGSP